MYVFTDKSASLVKHPNVPLAPVWHPIHVFFHHMQSIRQQRSGGFTLQLLDVTLQSQILYIHYGSLCMKMLFSLKVHQETQPLVNVAVQFEIMLQTNNKCTDWQTLNRWQWHERIHTNTCVFTVFVVICLRLRFKRMNECLRHSTYKIKGSF